MNIPIPLNVLTDAVAAMKMLRGVADSQLTTDQFMQALQSWSALHAYVASITKQIKIEVEA